MTQNTLPPAAPEPIPLDPVGAVMQRRTLAAEDAEIRLAAEVRRRGEIIARQQELIAALKAQIEAAAAPAPAKAPKKPAAPDGGSK